MSQQFLQYKFVVWVLLDVVLNFLKNVLVATVKTFDVLAHNSLRLWSLAIFVLVDEVVHCANDDVDRRRHKRRLLLRPAELTLELASQTTGDDVVSVHAVSLAS